MTTISEDLQKHFDEARVNLLRARTAYIKMEETTAEEDRAMAFGEPGSYDKYQGQQEIFENALGKVIYSLYEIHTHWSEPQEPEEGIYTLLTLLNKAF